MQDINNRPIHRSLPIVEKSMRAYKLLFEVNGVHIPHGDLQVIAFTAIKGTISSGPAKAEFISIFGRSKNSLYNSISYLKRKGILVEEDKFYRLHPKLRMDLTRDICLTLTLSTELKDAQQ